MVLGKITVKNDYEQKGDLVYRPLVRAYVKHGFDSLIEKDKVSLLGIIRDDTFYEIFTGEVIPYSNYEIVGEEEFCGILDNLTIEKVRLLKRVMNNYVFQKEKDYQEENRIMELAKDRKIEFDAYNRDLTSINPYQEPLNGYNDFAYKCQVLETLRGYRGSR